MDWGELTRGQRLKAVSAMSRVPTTDLAKKARVSKFTLYQVITDKQVGSVELWMAVSKALGVRLGWLLEGEGDIWRPRLLETPKAAEAPIAPAAPDLPLLSASQSPQKARRHR